MLNAMREGRGAGVLKFVALGFVMLGVGGMVFMDVGGFFQGGITDTKLARIGKTEITLQSFERMATPSVRAQNMSMQEAYRFGLLQNILDDMVAREAIRQEALREGLIISTDDIAARVHTLVQAQMQPGETAQGALERILATQGLTEGDLVTSMRQSLTTQIVQDPLKASVSFVPKLAASALGHFQAERRDIVFFSLTPESVGSDIKADDETLKAYYEGVKDLYQIPEQRSFRALALNVEDIKSTIVLSESDVKAAYDERRDQFKIGERRKIEQAIVPDESKAKEIAEAVRSKTSLSKAAGAAAYREPLDVEESSLPAELAKPVFEAQKNTTLNPIKTPLGWHVIRVVDVIPASVQNFNEVKADLRKELESDALHTETESRITKIDEALGQGDALTDIATALGLKIVTIGPVDIKGNFPADKTDPFLTALSQNKDLLSSLFELMEGETGDLAEINDNLYAVFSLESVTPTRDRDFAEIKDDLTKKWLAEQKITALNALVDKLVGELGQGTKTFEQAVADTGAVLKTARDVGRASKVAGLNDPIVLGRLFDETDFSTVLKVPSGDGFILAKVLGAHIPESAPAPAETEQQWRSLSEQAVASLFVSDLRRRHDVTVNTKLLDKMYGAKTDAEP